MDKSKRRTVIAGNWKMNQNTAETKGLLAEMQQTVKADNCDVVICTPFTSLSAALQATESSFINIGAQNVHFAKNGAYTGEISAQMLKELGVKYVITGHSERRQYFNETNETVNMRTRAAIDEGLIAIVCVGESLTEREQEITNEVVRLQTKIALSGFSVEDLKNVIIAYEPVWAIGTGRTASAEQAEEVCCEIRNLLSELYSQEVAQSVTIQYGGSMNAQNADELLSKPNVDGGLIGGASLKAADFAAIVAAASK